MKRTFRALTTVVTVVIDDDVPGAELARLMIAGYPDADEPASLAYHLHGGPSPSITCAGVYELPVADPSDVVPLFELDLYEQVAQRTAPGWLLHAAAVELGGGAVVFGGPSGAGKTTLTLALAARGVKIMTEEMVLIDRALNVRGLARPLHVPADGPLRRALPASWSQHEYPLRASGGVVRDVIAVPAAAHGITATLPLRALVRIGHEPECTASLELLPPHRAITRLWECTLRRDDDGLAAATAIVSAIRPHELVSSSVEDAVALVMARFAR